MANSFNFLPLRYYNLRLDTSKIILSNKNYCKFAINIFQKYTCVEIKDLFFLKLFILTLNTG